MRDRVLDLDIVWVAPEDPGVSSTVASTDVIVEDVATRVTDSPEEETEPAAESDVWPEAGDGLFGGFGVGDKVVAIVSDQMGVDKAEISRETSFVNDLNADSLDQVELVMELEDEFELSIPDEDAVKIQTVGQAIDYIKENGGAS